MMEIRKGICNSITIFGSFSETPEFEILPERNAILSYLKHYKTQEVVATGNVYDYIAQKSTEYKTETFYDGEFEWTTYEVFYFDKYNIKLNPEFIDKVLSK